MIRLFRQLHWVVFGGVTIIAVTLIAVLFITYRGAANARTVLEPCVSATMVDFACVRSGVAQLLTHNSPAELMHEIELTFPQQCHVIGHIVGQQVYQNSVSVEDALDACIPSGCGAACTHGAAAEAMVEVTGADLFSDDVHPTLEELRKGADYFCSHPRTCHVYGHLLFLKMGSLENALTECNAIADGLSAWSCYIGVFMENNNPMISALKDVAPRDYTVHDPDDFLSPCRTVEEEYKPGCYHFLFMNQFKTWRSTHSEWDTDLFLARQREACETLTTIEEKNMCAEGIGRSLYMQRSPQISHDVCLTFATASERASCTYSASAVYVEYGYAPGEIMDICGAHREKDTQYACYMGIFSALRVRQDPSLEEACPAHNTRCQEILESFLKDPENLPVAI